MTGCFGNSPLDRMRERELDDYLNSLDADDDDDYENEEEEDSEGDLEIICPHCDEVIMLKELIYHEDDKTVLCPECGYVYDIIYSIEK